MKIAALVLAAGRGTRFGGSGASKLLAEIEGVPLVRRAVEAAVSSLARPIFVVTGHAEQAVRAALAGLPVTFVSNADFAEGMSTSLRAGLGALGEVDGVLAMLGDMPAVRPATLDGLMASFIAEPQADAVVPLYEGHWGNPVLIARALFPEIATLKGDAGARKLLQMEGRRLCLLEVDDEGVIRDVDVPEDLAPLSGRAAP